MSSDDASVIALAVAIERYLQAHPKAADSPEGILAWWLPAPLGREPLSLVVAALEKLERHGVVKKTILEKSRFIYHGARRRSTER